MEEAGDIVGPIRDGVVDETVIVAEIGEVVMGRVQGRIADTDITFFKSVGKRGSRRRRGGPRARGG